MDEREREREEKRLVTEMQTRPSANGEAPLPRRAPRGLIPLSWLNHTVRLSYVGADGLEAATSGSLLELFPFGPALKSAQGDKFLVSWDRLVHIELEES